MTSDPNDEVGGTAFADQATMQRIGFLLCTMIEFSRAVVGCGDLEAGTIADCRAFLHAFQARPATAIDRSALVRDIVGHLDQRSITDKAGRLYRVRASIGGDLGEMIFHGVKDREGKIVATGQVLLKPNGDLYCIRLDTLDPQLRGAGLAIGVLQAYKEVLPLGRTFSFSSGNQETNAQLDALRLAIESEVEFQRLGTADEQGKFLSDRLTEAAANAEKDINSRVHWFHILKRAGFSTVRISASTESKRYQFVATR